MTGSVPVRSSAARAAHRELCSLLRLFRASYSWGICARTPWRLTRYRVVATRRSRAPVTGVTGPKKRRSERSSRCAARAALDLKTAEDVEANESALDLKTAEDVEANESALDLKTAEDVEANESALDLKTAEDVEANESALDLKTAEGIEATTC
ncbi:hypothetical protein KMS_R13750 [Pseudomonas sp. LRP2-20]|uniref:hypothetical protein n=1 Tax=Pseudomonas sp. LRP2-20 TaxID=2944234 RepID=UPI0021860236|nr:hypothetical protein [Pseudomonas sp. LRP2-20]BDM21617.1 hypothetical protein KMS_R13750 [Pseudomonas sp. LRP2-20]